MIPDPLQLYRATGPDHLAVVSTHPAFKRQGEHFVQIARAREPGKFGQGATYGPFPEHELPGRFAEVVAALEAEGFARPGPGLLVVQLRSSDSTARGRAAARLGWRGDRAAVGPLIKALESAVDDTSPILDALGAIGDPAAIPAVRPFVERKLLSRRRSAVEALRNLGDEEGLAAAVGRAREQLPAPVLSALDAIGPQDTRPESVGAIVEAVRALEFRLRGIALDLLYEIASPASVAAVRASLEELPFDRAYAWRYVKSIYKRSMLRHDPVTFGRLAHRIESEARRTKGTTGTVKSGYDGKDRQTPIFGKGTQSYARRLAWRYLRNLARHRPGLYPFAAAEALAAYGPEDAQEPKGFVGAFGGCYLLHRVLWGSSHRFDYVDRRMIFRFRDAKATKAPDQAREEAFPHLWDAHPRAHLRVLASARLPEALDFSHRALSGPHRRVLGEASLDEILPLLGSPHEPTAQLALDELGRRFDPARPDLALLDEILAHRLPMARELGRRWLRESAPLWTSDQEWVLVFLAYPDAETTSLAADLASGGLRDRPAMRRELAGRLLALLRKPEAGEGTHDVYARVVRESLIEEANELLPIQDLLDLVVDGSPPLQAMAGELIGRRPGSEAVETLGAKGLSALALHEVAAVRSGAQRLMRGSPHLFRADPSLLFLLVEADWDDTRGLALELLRDEVGPGALGPEGLIGLMDSNRPEAQALGRELILGHFAELDPPMLVERLAEHPQPGVRRFALDLAVEHLPDGERPLARLDWFFRAAVLDLWPERAVKRRVFAFLEARGLRDEGQARVAARLLGDFARLRVREDFEDALGSLLRLKLAYPDLPAPVALLAGAGGAP